MVALSVVLGTVAFRTVTRTCPINRKRGCVAGYTKREVLGRERREGREREIRT